MGNKNIKAHLEQQQKLQQQQQQQGSNSNPQSTSSTPLNIKNKSKHQPIPLHKNINKYQKNTQKLILNSNNFQSNNHHQKSHFNFDQTPTSANSSNYGFDDEEDLNSEFTADEIYQNSLIYCNKDDSFEDVQLEDFEMLKLVGKGNFAKVFQVRKLMKPKKIKNIDDNNNININNKNNKNKSTLIKNYKNMKNKENEVENKGKYKIFAMKVLNKSKLIEQDQLEHIKTERTVLQFIEHPFLVKLYCAFQTKSKLYMVLSFVNGGELFYHLKNEKRFSESRAQLYAAELFLVLEHIHKHSIIYRDLKPENVLLDSDGHVRLTDFGLSKILTSQQRTHTFCGTPEYLAPEILLNKGHNKSVDWWTFGTLLYEMLIGIPPYYDDDIPQMYNLILYSELKFPDLEDDGFEISEVAKDLLIKLLEKDPSKRIDAKGVRNHSFFKGLNWDDVLNKKIEPEFKPMVKNQYDVSFFEDEFTKQAVSDSYDPRGNLLMGKSLSKEFEGFACSGVQGLQKATTHLEDEEVLSSSYL